MKAPKEKTLANELRIGNLMMTTLTKNIVQVSEIQYETFRCKGYQMSKYPQYLPNECEPIPLNEDWLKGFGVLKWINHKTWSKKGVIVYFHSKDGFSYGKSRVRVRLESVHQLQNLFYALTGTELKLTGE